MAKSLKHLAGGFLLLSLHLGGVPALAQTEPTPTLTIDEQAAQLNEADRLRDKAFQLYQQEQYETALPLLQRALAIYEQTYGSDHPSVASSLNGLASIHRNMGNNSEAESLLQRALTIDEQAAQLNEADRLR
ncbi:MAG: tetratricopeptide repeat protein, partial [Jaaginema sp. PMC 1080.18]|nr:tetratricopeptide repeat protein [Jaaginema sp. PMC 1080.18]MEC4866481.1 tetratricopeptide repeat protein [Jaaginema sp. PMC 1078.18]